MTFLSLPLWGVIAGAIGLAGLVFALQVLKARQKRVRIAAAGLWAHAARSAPLRVFRQRFQRWLAYLLILAIALLLWFAGARPERAPDPDGLRHVFYLDASAGLTARDDFARASRALLADVRATDPAQREVYLGDATATPLLRPGENVALLARRLETTAARPRPSEFARFLATRRRFSEPRAKGPIVHYYGNWAAAGAALPAESETLVYGYLAPPVADNRGIVALGARPAGSGAADRADILVEAVDAGDRPVAAQDIAFTLDGAPVAARAATGEAGGLILRDVPASGGVFEARLTRGDAFAADDRASLRLPDRRRLRVALSPATPVPLRRAIGVDAGLEITDPETAQVAVRLAGEAFAPRLPALELAPTRDHPAFFLTRSTDEADGDLSADAAALGLDGLDVAALARTANRSVAVESGRGPVRGLAIWSLLFEEGRGFTSSADFPVFVGRAVRWVADPEPWIPFAAAGTDLIDQAHLYGFAADRRIASRAVNGDLHLGPAGEMRIGDLPVRIALTDRDVTLGAGQPIPPGVELSRRRGSAVDLPFLLLVALAGVLLLFEWRLHGRGWMP